MRFRNSFLFCCLLLAVHFSVQAQHLQKPVRVLTTKDGLPQSFISGLVQDTDGFVWIGTRNGLVRYDGIHFKLFQHSSRDTASLSSNLIISLRQDWHNRIWIEYESSELDCFDPAAETVDHVTARPLFRQQPVLMVRQGWLADTGGAIWCIQKAAGVYRYDWKQNKVTHFTRSSHRLPSDTIKGLLEDRQQQVWVISQRGISRFDATTGQFTHTLFPFAADFNNYENSNGQMVAVQERKNGELMLGDRQRLIFYNPTSKTFRTVPLPVSPATGIRWIQEGPDGYDYLESGGTVYRYNEVHHLVPVGDVGSAAARDVHSFLVDRSGFIWLGTNAAGIHQIDLSAPFFQSQPTTYSFHYDVLKAETSVLLDHFSGWPLSDKQFYATSYYFRSAYGPQQQLWMALRDKIGYYDAAQKSVVVLPAVPGISNPASPSWGIRGISFDKSGRLWIVSDKGYTGYFDAAQQQWTTFLTPAVLQQQINPDVSLVDLVTDENKLWVAAGSGNGLLCIDKKTKQVLQLSRKARPNLLPTDLILGLQPDPTRPHLLWIGTYEGLVCLNKNTLQSEIFYVEQGLPDNTIYAIQTDTKGYLWLSTNKGLCRFHPVTHQVRTFRTADGLPGDEFNRFHSLRLPDGRLAFGGTDGWALFDPALVKEDRYQPPVAFTHLQINNAPAIPATNGLLPAPLNQLTRLSLPYDQNTLTFEFAGLEFSQPSKIRYRYRLKNYSDDWIVTAAPLANYTKLPPGNYVLQVNATNTTGQWSPHIRSLAITVRPPWWRTGWAYGLYAILIASLVWAYTRYRIREERLQQEVLLKKREAEQLKAVDELKTRFYSNITHEFRTPLTLILAPAQQLKPELQTPEQHRRVEAIERNAYQLLQLINQLLDLAKIESGTLGLHETSGSLSSLAEELLLSFRSDAERRGIALLLKDETGNEPYWLDAEKLTQIITNLVANALKFTPEGGKVELTLRSGKPIATGDAFAAPVCAPTNRNGRAVATPNPTTQPAGELVRGDTNQSRKDTNQNRKGTNHGDEQPGVTVTISDTGIGIPPEQAPLVFDRFYQVNEEQGTTIKGTGIGLSLVKELVELQGGTIEVCSPGKESGWSTCFTIWLPLRKAETASVTEIEKQESPILLSNLSHPFQPLTFPNQIPTEEQESILLIEDNDELAAFIASSLPSTYAISRASNGAEGLEMAFAQVPDLIISDVVMPVMDGFECCRRLKTDERTNHIPVILLTAKAAFDSRITGLTQGADDYLTKPFHVQELQLRVGNLLQRQRRLREKWQQEMTRPHPEKPIADASLQIQLAKEQAVKEEVNPTEKPLNDLQEAFIQKLYAIVEEKLDETDFGVEDLATEIGMSRANLHRKLKALTGLAASDVVRNYRLQRAVAFLKGGFNSSETAYKTGFDSPAYFTKCFREFYGATPTDFLKRA